MKIKIEYWVMTKENLFDKGWNHNISYETYEECVEYIEYHRSSYPCFKIEKVFRRVDEK